ncbi:MAG: adenosylhomocysteinase [Acidimicrobiales bacterium]
MKHTPTEAEIGRGMIDFAKSFMPALAAATEVVREGGRLEGKRVGVALTLEPKTACLIEAIASLGASVAVLGSSNSTKAPVVAALTEAGISVFAEPGATPERARTLVDAFIDTRPQLLADDGASVARRIHGERNDVLADLEGVAEETTSGVRPLRNMEAGGELRVPCVAVNDARTKLAFDNIYGTSQSVVMALLDATNMQMQGKVTVVVGYGKVGRGIAAAARALGSRVTVTEIDPVEALVAHHDGFAVAPLLDALGDADFVITASGIGHSLVADHVAAMKDGAVIAVGGAGPPEFDPDTTLTGEPSALQWGETVRANIVELLVPDGPTVFVVSNGYCANTSAGEGNPIEVMDLSLALQLRALDYLAATDLAPGVHLLPKQIDDEVAASQLRAAGLEIDTPTAAQVDAATRW